MFLHEKSQQFFKDSHFQVPKLYLLWHKKERTEWRSCLTNETFKQLPIFLFDWTDRKFGLLDVLVMIQKTQIKVELIYFFADSDHRETPHRLFKATDIRDKWSRKTSLVSKNMDNLDLQILAEARMTSWEKTVWQRLHGSRASPDQLLVCVCCLPLCHHSSRLYQPKASTKSFSFSFSSLLIMTHLASRHFICIFIGNSWPYIIKVT